MMIRPVKANYFNIELDRPIYISQLGTYVEIAEESFFYEEETNIYMSRHFPNPCSNIKDSNILHQRTCESKRDERAKAEVLRALEEECTRQWEDQLGLMSYTVAQRQLQRNRRAILESIGLMATIISCITTSVSTLYHFISQTRINRQKINDVILKSKRNSLVTANIASHVDSSNYLLHNMICNSQILSDAGEKALFSSMLLESHFRHIEQEVLSLSMGQLPKSADFLRKIIRVCESFNANSHNFCLNLLYSKKLVIKLFN